MLVVDSVLILTVKINLQSLLHAVACAFLIGRLAEWLPHAFLAMALEWEFDQSILLTCTHRDRNVAPGTLSYDLLA